MRARDGGVDGGVRWPVELGNKAATPVRVLSGTDCHAGIAQRIKFNSFCEASRTEETVPHRPEGRGRPLSPRGGR